MITRAASVADHFDPRGQYRKRIQSHMNEKSNRLCSLRFVTHEQEWRLSGCGKRTKGNRTISLSLKEPSAEKNENAVATLHDMILFDTVGCVVQRTLEHFFRGLHGNHSTGPQRFNMRIRCFTFKIKS